jgi:LPXTG-motif cell wall-anchored protein
MRPVTTRARHRAVALTGAVLSVVLAAPVAALVAAPARATSAGTTSTSTSSPSATPTASTAATTGTPTAGTAASATATSSAATSSAARSATPSTAGTSTAGTSTDRATRSPASVTVTPAAVPTGPAAERAAAYLAGQLKDGDHVVGAFGPDLGQTADVVLALSSTTSQRAARDAAAAYLAAHVDDYVHGAAFADGSPGSEKKGANYAGPTGKAIVTALAAGQDPRALGGFDLVSELQGLMVTSGTKAGRFADDSAFGDFSNPVGQAFDIIALKRATGAVPDAAVSYLLTAQCSDGGFPDAFPASAKDCTSNPDSTGLALQALVAAGVTDATSDASCAAGAALAWLRAHDARNGSYASGAVNPSATAAANVNSTAYAALGLTAATVSTTAQIAYLASVQNSDGGLPIVPSSKDTTSNVLATAQALNALTRSTFLSLGTSPLPAAAPACTPTPTTSSQPTNSATAAAGTLPETGTDPFGPGLAGLALVLVGSAAVALSRRPRGARQR